MTDKRLISCRACDRLYGMGKGSASAAYYAGRLPGRWFGKPAKTRWGTVLPGKVLKVSAKRAEEIFGAVLCPPHERKTA
jgi:hypothetical protein